MSLVTFEDKWTLPESVVDHASFRSWARSESFPHSGYISWLRGEIWVDMSPENLFAHNRVKGIICARLDQLVREHHLGYFFHDRTLLSNDSAALSTEPDGLFVSYDSVRSAAVRWIEGADAEMEVEGAPDMVLEVISKTSRRKDNKTLRDLYFDAGIREYWIADALKGNAKLQILVRARDAYSPAEQDGEWQKSPIFGRFFRMTTTQDELGRPEHDLLIRD